nr:archaetidylserine decarboxylase [Planctomycetota bacterium]
MQRSRSAKISLLQKLVLQEDFNFLVTNRIPRRLATRFMGWFSKLDSSLLARTSIALWRRFAPDLDLSEAKLQRFRSLHDCFIRELKDGSRPIDPDPLVVTSPCDAIVGAFGEVEDGMAFQAKGFPYRIRDLLADDALVERYARSGKFVTLRLKSSFYHRFHAPCDGDLSRVIYIAGDTWNVNDIACERIERLFCKNERAVLDIETAAPGLGLTLVPVAAILVASIRLHCLPHVLDMRYRGPEFIDCDASFTKGDELGWFEHGSTIIAFASSDFSFDDAIQKGARLRV